MMNTAKPKHGKWSKEGVPHKGWVCFDIEDLGDPLQTCEMCEVQTIRYVHYMEHSDYDENLEVGCVCAGHMEEDYEQAKAREQKLKNAVQRRKNWLKRKWKISDKGNDYININSLNIVIFNKYKGLS